MYKEPKGRYKDAKDAKEPKMLTKLILKCRFKDVEPTKEKFWKIYGKMLSIANFFNSIFFEFFH